jgi:hypothetical protein
MGWAVFLIGCFITIPVGWLLLARSKADRLLSVVGLTLLPPTIWSAALGLEIGPCKVGSCVSHSEHNLLVVAVGAFVALALGLAALFVLRTLAGAALIFLAGILGVVAVFKIDKVTVVMFALLAAVAALYAVLALLPNRTSTEPGFPN